MNSELIRPIVQRSKTISVEYLIEHINSLNNKHNVKRSRSNLSYVTDCEENKKMNNKLKRSRFTNL